ncbi:unnamed protein product [Larinioides sclopetarius]|uniref:Uncharacterized protein n=1 Tax=Larinioides sclopetarius TaxID=280406 RepID=A0AAV2BJN2_9ARAC
MEVKEPDGVLSRNKRAFKIVPPVGGFSVQSSGYGARTGFSSHLGSSLEADIIITCVRRPAGFTM